MKPDWPFEQISDPPLRDAVCRQTYGIFGARLRETRRPRDLQSRRPGHHESEPPSRAPIACGLPTDRLPAASWHRHTNRQRPKLEVGPIAARSE
jgi:hypothetical protein